MFGLHALHVAPHHLTSRIPNEIFLDHDVEHRLGGPLSRQCVVRQSAPEDVLFKVSSDMSLTAIQPRA